MNTNEKKFRTQKLWWRDWFLLRTRESLIAIDSPTTNWKCWPVNCENAGLGRPAYVYCCTFLKGHYCWWTSIEFDGQAHRDLLLRMCRIVVGPCWILIKNSFCFIMQQLYYPKFPTTCIFKMTGIFRSAQIGWQLLSMDCKSWWRWYLWSSST
jgi:hypothetical protein